MEQVVTIGEGALRWLYIDTVKCPTKLHSYWVLIFLAFNHTSLNTLRDYV